MIITTVQEQRKTGEAARKVGGYQKLIELSKQQETKNKMAR